MQELEQLRATIAQHINAYAQRGIHMPSKFSVGGSISDAEIAAIMNDLPRQGWRGRYEGLTRTLVIR